MNKLVLLITLVIFFISCGSENRPGYTRVIFNKSNQKAILDGGILLGAANLEGIGGSYSTILADEDDFAVLEIPNGSYRFGGIGYTKNATSGTKISEDLRCGGADGGRIYNLNGQTLELNLTFDQDTCTSSLFADSNERDLGHPTNIPLVRFASCSVLPTASGGCAGGGETGAVVSLVSGRDGKIDSLITSNIFAIGAAGTPVTPGVNLTMRIPAGNSIVLPIIVKTTNNTYFFPYGFDGGTEKVGDATGEGVAFYNSGSDILEVYLRN